MGNKATEGQSGGTVVLSALHGEESSACASSMWHEGYSSLLSLVADMSCNGGRVTASTLHHHLKILLFFHTKRDHSYCSLLRDLILFASFKNHRSPFSPLPLLLSPPHAMSMTGLGWQNRRRQRRRGGTYQRHRDSLSSDGLHDWQRDWVSSKRASDDATKDSWDREETV
jgi:hypothetical protein